LRSGGDRRDGLGEEGDRFLGDTVNPTARIQELCRQIGDPVIALADLIDRLELPPGIANARLAILGGAARAPLRFMRRRRRHEAPAARRPKAAESRERKRPPRCHDRDSRRIQRQLMDAVATEICRNDRPAV
jgi:hypothetical protein